MQYEEIVKKFEEWATENLVSTARTDICYTSMSTRIAFNAFLAAYQLGISNSIDGIDAKRYRWIRSKTDCRLGTAFKFPSINTLSGLARAYSLSYIDRFDACVDAHMELDKEETK